MRSAYLVHCVFIAFQVIRVCLLLQEFVYYYSCPGYTFSTFISKSSCFTKPSYTGRLNGACKNENFYVPLNSPYLQCTSNEFGYRNGLLIFLFEQMFSVTLIVILITVLNIKFKWIYLLLSDCVSLISWKIFQFISQYFITMFDLESWLFNIFIISSLYYTYNGSHGVIAFWYFRAAYPFFLLLFLYGLITMYNKGFRCVVTMIWPLHLLAWFWCMTNIQPSFTHSISSI